MKIKQIISNYITFYKEGKEKKDKRIILKYALARAIKKILGTKGLIKIKKELTVQNQYGTFYCGKNIYSGWCASSTYEKDTMKKIKIGEGSFIDLGANIGKYSIKVARENSNVKVYAVEPESTNYQNLLINIKLNNLKNVTPIKKAIYSKEGKMDLGIDNLKLNGNSLINHPSKIVEKVDVTTLDSLIKEYKIKNVKMIKMDIEGAEFDALIGGEKLLKRGRPIIIFETVGKEMGKINQFLKKIGYDISCMKENFYAYVPEYQKEQVSLKR